MDMDKEPLNLLQFVSEVVEHVGAPADRERIQIETTEWVPPVSADPARLERALMNLLTNALKYSPPDSPVVVRVACGDGEAVISVSDRGPGIPPEELPHLFQRYYRSRSTTAKKVGGLGLGLYITRLIAEAHRGRVWVESEPGQGSTFYFALPLA
jgi:signal transduction histidine kinase